jgi:hypothetical protein
MIAHRFATRLFIYNQIINNHVGKYLHNPLQEG